MNKIRYVALFLLFACSLPAARIDTVAVYSDAMKRNVKVVTIVPEAAMQGKACPVVYLLHGHGGNEQAWPKSKPGLGKLADELQFIFVSPDGKNSWYWDAPADPSSRYETFISKELVSYIDSHFPTIVSPKGRAITGYSMGGHGALWNAIRHTDVFGAAGSLSGGVDIRPFPDNWNMKRSLGEMKANPEVWDNHTVITQVGTLKNKELAIIIDCGYDDFFYDVNEEFHKALRKAGIDHDYLVRPGGHDWNYWRNASDYQLLFFKKFFDKNW
ncbi:MAG: esterase family protein [Tannerellaceae bacterium]|nr:esterase family protein [Tannerellaceae bacterium]